MTLKKFIFESTNLSEQSSYVIEHWSSQKVGALAWLGVNVFMDGKHWFCVLLVIPTEVILGFRVLIIWKILDWIQLWSNLYFEKRR